MGKMRKVLMAEPYSWGALGGRGNARQMLVRQFQFPLEFDEELDQLVWADHDRLEQHYGLEVCSACFKKHTGKGAGNLHKWLLWNNPRDAQFV